eukprot:jgi/Chlat1/7694/Chrsp64S07145
MATAKARLHQLCVHRLNGEAPTYATLPAEGGKGGFISTVTLPDGSVYMSAASSASKKMAEQAAAQAALDAGVFASQSAAGPRYSPMEQLQQWLQQQLSSEVLSQVGYIRTTAALALRFNDKCIPLTALLTKKALDTCCAVNDECGRDIRRAVSVLQHAVRETQQTHIALTKDGLHVDVSLPEPLRSELWQMAGESIQAWRAYEQAREDTQPNKRVSSLEFYSVAVIPSNIEHDVHDVLLPVEAYYFASIAKALNATTVLQSQRVGTSASDCHIYVPMNDVGSTTETLNLPLNTRASALLRHPVYGDAILAEAGPSYKGNLNCGIRYKNVTASTYHKLVLLTTPDGMYRSSRRSLHLSRLPHAFRGRTRWRGPLPRVLLEELCAHRGWRTPTYAWKGKDWRGKALCTSEDEHHISARPPAMFEASVSLSSMEGQNIMSSRAFKLLKDAQNSAALTALWAIASLDGEKNGSVKKLLLSPAVNEAKRRRVEEVNAALSGSRVAAVVEEGQGATQPEVDAVVCVEYWLAEGGNATAEGPFLQEGETPLEHHDSFEFELGGGGVHEGLDAIVSRMQEGETVRAPLVLTDDLDGATGELRTMMCQVTLRSWSKPAEDRMEDQIFFPSLATQRMEFVDLGCGDGKLLTALWRNTQVKHLIGVDISNSALERFAMFCKHKLVPNAATTTTSSQHDARCIETYVGSVADCEAGLVDTCGYVNDVDVVTMIEVIEHLDPEPLQAVGTNILKNYAPRVAIVSTPNVEYNPLLDRACTHTHSAQGEDTTSSSSSSSGVRLRNEDHRFEWTRAEFEQWARPLARTYGYRVRFSGVGVMTQGEEKKLGFATQIAVFQRIDDPKRQESRRSVYTLHNTFRTSGSAQVQQQGT